MTREGSTARGAARPRSTYPRAADVARLAGVSTATVSLVVNGKAERRVASPTVARVEAAVATLGYRVDAGARGLATGRHQSVALLIPDVADPFFGQVAMGVVRGLGRSYRLVLVVAAPEDRGTAVLDEILDLRVDGLLVDSTAIRAIGAHRPPCPMVLLDVPGGDVGAPSVEFEVEAGARALAEHLIGLGHRRFVYLDWAGSSATFEQRRLAVTRHLTRLGGPAVDVRVERSRIEVDDAARLAGDQWNAWREVGVTACVCATDLQAYGVIRSVQSSGARIPDTLSVAGFNDLEFSRIIEPGLTSVALPAVELGARAAMLLRDLIAGHRAHRPRRIPTRLVVRGSTGAPRVESR